MHILATRGNKAWRVRADSTQSNLVRASARSDKFPLVNPPRPHTTTVVCHAEKSRTHK